MEMLPATWERDVSGQGHAVRDAPVTAGMSLIEVECRLVETARIRALIWKLAVAASDIGLDACWLNLESVEDQLVDALNMLRRARSRLLTQDEHRKPERQRQ